MVQSNKSYKFHTVGVTSKVGLTTDWNLAEHSCLRNTSFIPPTVPEVTWYEPLCNKNTKWTFKLVYNNVALLHVSHYAMRTPPKEKLKSKVQKRKMMITSKNTNWKCQGNELKEVCCNVWYKDFVDVESEENYIRKIQRNMAIIRNKRSSK